MTSDTAAADSSDFEAFRWVDLRTATRAKAGLIRTLRPRPAYSRLLDLAGNDYLGLTRHPEVTGAAAAAARRWGAGATGSRVVTGTTELHAELEYTLAQLCGTEAALVFATGYAANLAVLQALSSPGTLIVSDAANHASLIDGARLSRAQVSTFAHGDVQEARTALAENTKKRALLVSDAVFSVDGDLAPLVELGALAREFGAGLIVDDAHGLGVVGDRGQGAAAAAGLAGRADVVITTTLSKALGAQGGAVLGPRRVIDYLVSTARTFIFDTALAPAAAAGALAAAQLLGDEPGLAGRCRAIAVEMAEQLRHAGLDASQPAAAVVSVRAPSPEAAVAWAANCRAEGVQVGCFRPPSVPDTVSRLRLTARADLTPAEVSRAVEVLARTKP
ncbi:8-amino-7-oxononanoate synthase [Pseudonocardiaceae bacterium YIM PH 21723]|nr:8-amino-7-oxononanoate synthase [Pseudonocardiaceae bacterium YIM PH 21723]